MQYSTKIVNNLSSKDFLRMCTLSYMMRKKDSAYGREIIKYIQSKSVAWHPSHGSLYPLLGEMVDNNMIYVYDEDMETKIKRYKLTTKGANYYNDRAFEFRNTLKKTSEFFNDMADDLVIMPDTKSKSDKKSDTKEE